MYVIWTIMFTSSITILNTEHPSVYVVIVIVYNKIVFQAQLNVESQISMFRRMNVHSYSVV